MLSVNLRRKTGGKDRTRAECEADEKYEKCAAAETRGTSVFRHVSCTSKMSMNSPIVTDLTRSKSSGPLVMPLQYTWLVSSKILSCCLACAS